jgi:hypothetical protein
MTKKRPYIDRADRLKAFRGEISVDAFAKELGINLTTYYRYERGDTPVSDGYLKLAEIISKKYHFDSQIVSEDEKLYEQHAGWKPRSIEELTGLDSRYKTAFIQLLDIFESKHDFYKRAVAANLQAASEAIKQLDESEKMLKQQAKMNAYHGVERRSGIDRRQYIDPKLKAENERRSGIDRRKPPDC